VHDAKHAYKSKIVVLIQSKTSNMPKLRPATPNDACVDIANKLELCVVNGSSPKVFGVIKVIKAIEGCYDSKASERWATIRTNNYEIQTFAHMEEEVILEKDLDKLLLSTAECEYKTMVLALRGYQVDFTKVRQISVHEEDMKFCINVDYQTQRLCISEMIGIFGFKTEDTKRLLRRMKKAEPSLSNAIGHPIHVNGNGPIKCCASLETTMQILLMLPGNELYHLKCANAIVLQMKGDSGLIERLLKEVSVLPEEIPASPPAQAGPLDEDQYLENEFLQPEKKRRYNINESQEFLTRVERDDKHAMSVQHLISAKAQHAHYLVMCKLEVDSAMLTMEAERIERIQCFEIKATQGKINLETQAAKSKLELEERAAKGKLQLYTDATNSKQDLAEKVNQSKMNLDTEAIKRHNDAHWEYEASLRNAKKLNMDLVIAYRETLATLGYQNETVLKEMANAIIMYDPRTHVQGQ
jgi:hypothetical protein